MDDERRDIIMEEINDSLKEIRYELEQLNKTLKVLTLNLTKRTKK